MAQLTCQNLRVGYDGKSVLQDLSFEVFAGDYLCIVGENGSGKSTLMKTILGLQPPISGRILTGDGLRKNEIGYKRISLHPCERSFSPGVRGAAAAAPFITKKKNSLPKKTFGKCRLISSQSGVIESCPAGSNSGYCLPVRCAPHKKCCSWTSLFPGLIPK